MSSPPPKHSLSSPTSGNTPHPVVLPTPSSSTSVSFRQKNNMNLLHNKNVKLREELEQQLVEKQKLLQESSSGIGKNVLARQVSQLQDRLKELDVSTSPTSVNPTQQQQQSTSVDRLRSLERDLSSYSRTHPLSPGISSIRNKEKFLNQRSPVSSASSNSTGLDPLPSPSTSTLLPPPQTHGHDSTSLLPLPPPPTGSTPTKRRSKVPNTDRRNTDIEFATEIGQGLLLEVRKMQALLQEKEEKLRTLENQKADLERAAEAMAKQMRQREENEEKLKEETWNLELAKQELTISVTELQQNLSKANVEQNKLAKQVNELRSEIEHLRDSEQKLTNTIDNMKQRHEQDMSSIRRHAAAIQREKTDQTKQIEALTSELAIAKAQSRIGKHTNTESDTNGSRSGETADDQAASVLAVKSESSPSTSPPASPKQTPTAAARNQAMEVETLKTSLAHAHRMVSNLRSNLHKEKTEKFEFKKLLAESQETIEQLQNDPRMWVDAGPTRGGSQSNSSITRGGGEDGLLPGGRRSHKASISSSKKRNNNKKNAALRHKLRNGGSASQNATADDDSVYSYSSMSDQEDEDDSEVDSFDESDAGFGNMGNKKKSVGFTPLSSELSQVQQQTQKPIMVDAEVNTDPIDDFTSSGTTTAEPRSLGDELGMVMSSQPNDKEESSTSLKNLAGGLVAGAAAALGVESLMKKEVAGVEISTQTEQEELPAGTEMFIQTDDSDLEQTALSTVSVEPKEPVELQLVSQAVNAVEPEDPSIALKATEAAIAAAVLAARQSTLDAAVDSSVQCDPEDPAIGQAATEAAILAFRQAAFEAAVHTSVQSEPEDPSIAEAALATAVAAGIAASRQSDLEKAIDSSVQCDEPEKEDPAIAEAALAAAVAAGIAASRQSALEAGIDTSVQSEPEDPSIAEAALASAVAAGIASSRSTALEAAISTSVQSEPEDPSITEAATLKAIAAARQSALEAAIDSSVQCDEPENEDPAIALAATAAAVAAGIAASRSTALEAAIDQETQFDAIVSTDSGVQSEAHESKDASVQVEKDDSSVTTGTAILAADAANKSVDHETQNKAQTKDADVQHEVESTSIGVQCEVVSESTKGVAPLPLPVSARTAFSTDSEDDFFDATSDSKPSSRRTINGFAPIAEVDNMKLDSRNSKLGQEESVASGDKQDKNNAIIPAATAVAAAALSSAAVMHNNNKFVPADKNGVVVTSPSEHVNNYNNHAEFNLTPKADKEIQILAPTTDKMYSKEETDALIATAVALALAKAAENNKSVSANELESDDAKRHNNNQDADSAVISPSSAVSSNIPRTDDDEDEGDSQDYGNVVVHLPREEDTITSLPFDQIAEQKRHRGDSTLSNQAPSAVEQEKKQAPELTVGPTIIFAQEPEESEVNEADIPQRPVNPPPVALLNRAGLSPTFTESRSMSPTSNRSYSNNKGKAPLNDYHSDLDSTSSPPSHEDLQRAAALQQLNNNTVNKRHSLASSISTTNTNEIGRSIHSTDRNNGTTDPTMISLITQTMIGDWLWKYTRRTMGGGLSENRHKRYFWIHPYTRTLNWSTSAPGSDGSESKFKTAMIENIITVPDYHNANDGTPNISLLIQTSHRQLKLTAPNMEIHEKWFEAVSHLIARNKAGNALTNNDMNNKRTTEPNVKNHSISSGTSGSLLNRPSFRRLNDIFHHSSSAAPSMTTSTDGADHISFDNDYDEALEDVRMCCNGKHHVSKLEKDHTHRHQYRKRKSRNNVNHGHNNTNGAISTIG